MTTIEVMVETHAKWNGTAYQSDAGNDLTAKENVTLNPGEHQLVHTGIHVNFPPTLVAYIMPRSGLAAKHGITVLNAPGVIDSGYTGEIQVCLINLGSEKYECKAGDNIAQIIFHHVEHPTIKFTQTLPETKRGGNGFGSTDEK